MQMTFPTSTDLIVLAIAYIWVVAVLGCGELLRRLRNLSASITRKFIHLGAGFSTFTIPFFTNAWMAIIVSVSFMILVFLASPKSPVKSLRTMFDVMAREEDYMTGHIWGPFLYTISITVLVSIFTLIPSLTPFFVLPAMALTAMYLGDGLAPIIGGKFGKHPYSVGKATRTLEGSSVVFFASILGALFSYLFLDWFASGGAPIFSLGQACIFALTCGIAATFIEAVSPPGIDNLTVPLLTTIILFFIALFLHPPMLGMIMAP